MRGDDMDNVEHASPTSIYSVHKYWGKKPSAEIKRMIKKYSKRGDLIVDPFSGYGGLGIEGVLLGRNVILNDLNPIATFISECIVNSEINFKVADEYFEQLKKGYAELADRWYKFKGSEVLAILRTENDEPLKLKLMDSVAGRTYEYKLSEEEKEDFLREESNIEQEYWFPENHLIKNSRINARENSCIADLFSKRALLCQSFLYKLIAELPEGNEKKLFKLAFTANVANCSKLVPPIESRGDMAPGAWMTGFYVGKKYLENNVFHYFENRVNKALKGKKDFVKLCKSKKNIGTCILKNENAKNLSIESDSVDFVFTDFPYGDTVPYFEQSQLWNSWLQFNVDYENEIVISDSTERNKDIENFSEDIENSIREIGRILKNKAYFVFTYHSLSGKEWETISNAMLNNNFDFVDCKMLSQKTFTPRQLNRKMTVKGDMLVVYRKNEENRQLMISFETIRQKIYEDIKKNCVEGELYDTNYLITLCVKCLLKYSNTVYCTNFIEIIKEYFEVDITNEDLWRMKNDL